jgi:hypothetical protein
MPMPLTGYPHSPGPSIDIPLNGEQSEKFIYYPKQVIPQEIEQKVVGRLGDWVYIRE